VSRSYGIDKSIKSGSEAVAALGYRTLHESLPPGFGVLGDLSSTHSWTESYATHRQACKVACAVMGCWRRFGLGVFYLCALFVKGYGRLWKSDAGPFGSVICSSSGHTIGGGVMNSRGQLG